MSADRDRGGNPNGFRPAIIMIASLAPALIYCGFITTRSGDTDDYLTWGLTCMAIGAAGFLLGGALVARYAVTQPMGTAIQWGFIGSFLFSLVGLAANEAGDVLVFILVSIVMGVVCSAIGGAIGARLRP